VTKHLKPWHDRHDRYTNLPDEGYLCEHYLPGWELLQCKSKENQYKKKVMKHRVEVIEPPVSNRIDREQKCRTDQIQTEKTRRGIPAQDIALIPAKIAAVEVMKRGRRRPRKISLVQPVKRGRGRPRKIAYVQLVRRG
jgi:hypothetical protein